MKKEYTIYYDDSYAPRIRVAFIPNEILCKYAFKLGMHNDPPNRVINHEEAEKILKKIYWLPKDFYVVQINKDVVRCGLVVMISSKTFERVSEFGLPPAHLDRKNKKCGKK